MKSDAKKKVIKKHQTHDKDTGSPQVQVAILTKKIDDLSEHLKIHAKDNHSRKGLLQMVGKRRSLLNYLKNKSKESYDELIASLKLRK